MSAKRKICVYTTTRAEYGLLKWIIKEIHDAPDLDLCLFVTGMHLSREFGYTYNDILADGFEADEAIDMLLSSDKESAAVKSIALGMVSVSEAFERHKPDFLLVLGDRFELMAAVQPALFQRIPIVHLFGGDTSEGAYDESTRHAITKMASIHCAASEDSVARILQMGENPSHVHHTGNPGLDILDHIELMNRQELEESLGMALLPKSLLVCYHPVTLDDMPQEQAIDEVIAALAQCPDDETSIIITMPNADPGGRVIARKLQEFADGRKNSKTFTSLGHLRYLSAVQHVSCVVGNSSSGLHEAPTMKTPTVNIGDRQKGRTSASSVLNVRVERSAIFDAIERSFSMDCCDVVNPYYKANASRAIVDIIRGVEDPKALVKKKFFSIQAM
jgi:UDP-N-acetylglucosamine 2-epimerase (non-hydrolysing)/GDP/UDP-N,N'-diacetylbacillosamine 2-epimerase (hydrolysing)